MDIEIRDETVCISVLMDSSTLLLSKAHIRSIEVVRDNMVKIDTSQGPLNQIYIKYTDVVYPRLMSGPEDLMNVILAILRSGTGGSTIGIIDGLGDVSRKLTDINTSIISACDTETRALLQIAGSLEDIKTLLDRAYNIYYEPLRIDEGTPGIIYKGYVSNVAGGPSESVWAIQKIKTSASITVITWANGNKNFTNIWDSRALLTYIP